MKRTTSLVVIGLGCCVGLSTALAQGMPGDPIIIVPQQQEMPGEALIIESADDAKDKNPKEAPEPGVTIERVPRNTGTQTSQPKSAPPQRNADLAKFRPMKKPSLSTQSSSATIENALASPSLFEGGSKRQAIIPLNGIQLSGAANSALRRLGFSADQESITVTWPAPGQDGSKLVSKAAGDGLNFYGEFFECRTGERYVCGLTIGERDALAAIATRSQDENCPIELSDNATTFTPSSGSGDRGAFLDGPFIDVIDVMTAVTLWDRGEIGVPEWAAFMNASCNRACGRPGVYRAMSWRPGGLEYVHQGYQTAFASCSAAPN